MSSTVGSVSAGRCRLSTLAFASEIPPLLEIPGISRRANPQRVYDYLRWARVDHGAETMFADIRQVQPAHYLAEHDLAPPAESITAAVLAPVRATGQW